MEYQQKKRNRIGLKLLVTTFLLFGVISTLSHYLAPRPDASATDSQFQPVGREWFLEQLPLYDLNPITTFLHLVPAFIFMLLLGFQLSRSFREKRPKMHRYMGRLLSVLAVSFAISGVLIGLKFPFGGAIEMLTSSLVGIIFLCTLFKGVSYAIQKNFTEHRLWMFRMVAVSFTPITMRLLMMPIGFLQLAEMQNVFGALMIISAIFNLAILELVILKKAASIKLSFNKKISSKLVNS